jgi:hypothetical protein
LFTHLRLGLFSGLFPSGFPINILYSFLFTRIRATCPAHLILLDLVVLIILEEECPLWVPCHHGMARPQVANGGDALQVWRVAANILNKQ